MRIFNLIFALSLIALGGEQAVAGCSGSLTTASGAATFINGVGSPIQQSLGSASPVNCTDSLSAHSNTSFSGINASASDTFSLASGLNSSVTSSVPIPPGSTTDRLTRTNFFDGRANAQTNLSFTQVRALSPTIALNVAGSGGTEAQVHVVLTGNGFSLDQTAALGFSTNLVLTGVPTNTALSLNVTSFLSSGGSRTLTSTSAIADTGTASLVGSFAPITLLDALQGAVTVSTGGPFSALGEPTVMTAKFTPNFGLSLAQAAQLGGFTGFNWVQTVVSDPPLQARDIHGNLLGLSYPDPPPGGYLGHPGSSSPFFYTQADLPHTTNTLSFEDQPRDSCFSQILACNGNRVPDKHSVFETELVGVLAGNIDGPDLFDFTWTSNYSGVLGGVAIKGNDLIDSGGGTGGVTILSETYFPTAAVPEPTTWAMMLLGFAGIGFLAYRRKSIPVLITA
jgi:hypothetical protein